MRFRTAALARAALLLATFAAASAASAQPIRILNAATQPRTAPPTSDCAPAEAGADIECVLSLMPPRPGAAPSRIVIRAQWAPRRCAPRVAQVVDLAGPPARARGLPTIDQAGSKQACAS